MKPITIGAWCAGVFLATGCAALSWGQDPIAARNLASACFTCHGTDGHSVGGVPPSLAGRDRSDLLQAMKDFKADKRPATIMHQQAKGYTDQELETLAGYFAGVKARADAASPASRY